MSIEENLLSIKTNIAEYAKKYHRDLSSIHLLAVSKSQPVSIMKQAYDAGQRHFGENYVQEALEKIDFFKRHPDNEVRQDPGIILQWHFIGPIQSNKTRDIAENFDWVHSVDRIKIAERLSSQRPANLPTLKIFLQVNLDNEPSKSGFLETEILAAAKHITTLPHLDLQGLMIIPAPRNTFNEQSAVFAKLAKLQEDLIAKGLNLTQTSMGMSHDFEAAIAAGSNWLRLGTAIFGKR